MYIQSQKSKFPYHREIHLFSIWKLSTRMCVCRGKILFYELDRYFMHSKNEMMIPYCYLSCIHSLLVMDFPVKSVYVCIYIHFIL